MATTPRFITMVSQLSLFRCVALLLQISSVAFATKNYRCSLSHEMCTLTQVTLETDSDIERASFGELENPLVIESGRIPNFSSALASKLSGVNDLRLDGLGIVKLYVRADYKYLFATKNEIDELLLDEAGDEPYSLLFLKLSNNKLTALPSLERFVELYSLELDHNLLTTLDMSAFSKLSVLGKLSLAHNRLHTVTSQVQLKRLTKLSFAGNQLTTLDMHAWEMDALESFSVASNNLNRIEGNLTQFTALKSLYVAGNRLYCDWLIAEPVFASLKPSLQIDSDKADRCEQENMIRYMDHCCTHRGKDSVSLLDVYQDKWDQLQRLTQLIGTLNASIANGSTTVKPLLESQHEALSTRLDELLKKQQEHSEDLERLEESLGQHRDGLDTLETGLSSRMEDLRTELDAKWNETLSAIESDGASSNGSSVLSNWTQVTAQHETALSKLREELESMRSKLNFYTGKGYDQRIKLKGQSERIEEFEKELSTGRSRFQELKNKYDKLEDTVSATYEYYRKTCSQISLESSENF